ncbi:MAG: threonine/serine exporter family protein, partial [Planctomycetota bacterium]
GLARIAAVLAAPARRRRLLLPLACGLAGAAAGVLFGRGVLEAGFAGIAGMVVGLLALLARLRPGFADVLAPLACALVAFAANVAAASGIRIDPVITTLAAIVVLLPGLSFTTALAELAMRHLSSGSARLLGAVAVLATMAVGVTIGDRCARAIVGWAPAVNAERLGVAWHLLALAATWLAYVILLGAVKKQAGWILLAVAIGYGGSWFGSRVLEAEDGAFVGAFVGALAVSFTANLCARWRRLPAAVVRTPGLLLLVPGSLGFRGLTSAAIPTATASAPLILQMLLVGGSIVAGMLIAGVLLPPPLDVEPDSRRRLPAG